MVQLRAFLHVLLKQYFSDNLITKLEMFLKYILFQFYRNFPRPNTNCATWD